MPNGIFYHQLVHHDESAFEWYGIHEALIEKGQEAPHWVGSKAVRSFNTYHEAVAYWSKTEKLSGVLDIMAYDVVEPLFDRVDYSDNEDELNF